VHPAFPYKAPTNAVAAAFSAAVINPLKRMWRMWWN